MQEVIIMNPQELKYTPDHEWVRIENDLVYVGITDHAQNALGDIVYVDLPKPGAALAAGKAMATVESVKAVAEVFAPLSGSVERANDALDGAPELLNEAPYDGWIAVIRFSSPAELETLLDAAAYEALCAKEG